MIFQKENDEILAYLATKNNMDMESVIAAYLVMGDKFDILLQIFEGRTLKIPSKRKLNCPNLNNIHFIEDDERKYFDYVKGNIISIGDNEYKVISSEKKILNHYYLPVELLEE